jgi:MFS family permease
MPKYLSISILALALFMVTFAVNLQAPLYSSYVGQNDLGATAVTIAFAAYVAGLMPSLLLLGGLSDRIGRRVPICFALLLGVLATCLLVVIPGWGTLVFARFLMCVGTAFATTAGTAYMTEIMGEDRARQAALMVTSATSLGFGGGALATGISITLQGHSFLPASFMVLFVLAPALAIGILALPRADVKKAVSLLRLPVFPNGTWIYGTAMALAWSATGMTIAVVPLQLEQHGLANWTGPVIFLAIFIGFLCQPIAKKMSNTNALGLGFVMVPAGFCTMLFGAWSQQISLVLLGTAITSGASYGFSYLASLSEFSIRAPENRARATAGLFVYAYVGFSIPVIASGALADKYGLLNAMGIFGVALVIITTIVVVLWKRASFVTQPSPA